ncbi:MAG TPA: glycosyltransferase [Steroidobacteraceae bacterium]|nr:glycosyltransferase [Steroidobacteraceae bacterium]
MIEAKSYIEISVIVPVEARHGDVPALYSDYKAACEKLGRPYEFIFVLDGQYPQVRSSLEALRERGEPVTIVSLTRGFGESTALMAGFERALGSIVMTLPGYDQVQAADLPKLVDALGGADVAIGLRWPRAGGRFEALRRTGFHRALRWVTGLQYSDLGCGARAMRRRVIEEIFLYGDQHRFLAVLAHRQGFRVVEVQLRQSPKDRFEGHYRLREYAHRTLDIVTVLFLVRFTKKPLRFFGMIGLSLAGIGVALLLYLVVTRLAFGEPLADRPALLLTSLLVVLGLQLFAIGLLGELIIFTHARDIKDYQVESVIQFAADAPQPAATNDAQDQIAAR